MDEQTSTRNLSLRQLPPVHALIATASAKTLLATYSRARVVETVRAQLARLRQDVQRGDAIPSFCPDTFFAQVQSQLQAQDLTRLQRAINATGIVIHTNMGRAPLAVEAIEAVRAVTAGYTNLEMDLLSGKRGGRGGQTEERLCRLTRAEAALVVNNNAAAVLLGLGTLARGGEVIISRGELVEIGGAFRIPDVIAQSGARLVEVGTTNKTRLADYATAITPETRVLLKVHASNYRIIGFTAEASLASLVDLGQAQKLPVMYDLGSGVLIDLVKYGLPPEPTVGQAIQDGAEIVAFSGDKLLGGPQCGILVGKTEAIHAMGAHPLFRALRADKMTLAALEATLGLYEDEDRLQESLPVLRMLTQTPAQLMPRARRLRKHLAEISGLEVQIGDGLSYSGGGTLPEAGLPTKLVRVRPAAMSVAQLAERLRRGRPPVIGMLADDQFVIDLRTVQDQEIPELVQAFRVHFP